MIDPLESFSAYVRARISGLSRIAFLLTGDHHLAEDLVQQTLLRVVGQWGRIVAAGDPDAYVRRTLYHQHISWWRRRCRTPESVGAAPEPLSPDPSDAVVATVGLQRALAQLAPRQRAVLVLRYFEDLSEAQTARLLGISVGTVKSQTRDGLARLRQLTTELTVESEVQA